MCHQTSTALAVKVVTNQASIPREAEMFAIHCPNADARVLIWISQIAGLRNTDHGIEVAFRCWCGEPAVLLTGRHREAGDQLVHPLGSAPAPELESHEPGPQLPSPKRPERSLLVGGHEHMVE
jgi:hypothetical protein